jgi:ubiquinone/menaquinone biosynthesis C-methylase UbiE
MLGKLAQKLKVHSPSLYRAGQHGYWKIMEARARILGTKIHEDYWSKRHEEKVDDWNKESSVTTKQDWIDSYWDSKDHGHRALLLESLSRYAPFQSVLEVGCNCGPNLYRIADKYPQVEVTGIDINEQSIELGRKLFEKTKITNVNLIADKADGLAKFPDKHFDIVFTDAVLIYLGPDKINPIITQMLRIAKKAVILVEWHISAKTADPKGLGLYHFGLWKRDYSQLLNTQISPPRQIRLIKIPSEAWPNKNWQDLGYIIEASL